jgi:hypothetical protein
MVIGLDGIAAWDALPTSEKNKVGSAFRTTFLHQSVGQDLEDGSFANGYKFEYITSTSTTLKLGLNGGLFNSSNGNGAGKTTEFRNLALANQATLRVAIMKFGYADVVSSNIATAQSNYVTAVNAVKAQGTKVVHITPPLVYNLPGDNVPKMQMRSWMMTTFPDDVIFDLEDVESIDPTTFARCERGGAWEICDSIRSTSSCVSRSQGVDAPSGQGHLCYAQATRLAKAFLYSIYQAGK